MRRSLKIGGIVLANLLLALALGEGLLRLFPSFLPAGLQNYLNLIEGSAEGYREIYRFDADIGIVTRANIDVTTKSPDGHEVHFKTSDLFGDGLGFLSSSYERGASVILGDSMGVGEGLRAHIGQVLERRDAEGKWVNLSQTSLGTIGELAILKRYLLRLEPRRVVLLLYLGNDMFDNAVFDSNFAKFRDRTSEELERARKRLQRAAEEDLRPLRLLYLWEYVAKPGKFARFARRAITLPNGITVERPSDRPAETPDNYAQTDLLPPTDSILLLRGYAETEKALREIRDLLKTKNISFLVVMIPTKEQVYFEELGAVVPEAKRLIRKKPNERLAAFFEAENIQYLDLLASFIEAKKTGPLYWPVDPHWTPAAHEVAAKEILQAVKK